MIHIQRFIERLQGAEARGQKDYVMPLRDAKDLHADITKLLLALETLRSKRTSETETTEIITVNMDGGSFR